MVPAASDTLTGDPGEDVFVFMTGWEVGKFTDLDAIGRVHDRIDLSALVSITGWNDLKNHHLSQVSDDVVINGRNGDTLILMDIDIADLDEADFIF